jgi:hypothetical protein
VIVAQQSKLDADLRTLGSLGTDSDKLVHARYPFVMEDGSWLAPTSPSLENDGHLTSHLEDPTDVPSNDTSMEETPGPINSSTPTANSTRTFDERSPNPAPMQRDMTFSYSTLRPPAKSGHKPILP